MFWRSGWVVVCLVVACVLGGARPVHAAEPQAQQVVGAGGYKEPYRVETGGKRRTKIWYGYQTLAVDALAVGMMWVGLERKAKTLGWAGVGTYMLGAPLVHLAHGGSRTPLKSFGLRLVPAVIVVVGLASCVVTMGAGCGLVVVGLLTVPVMPVIDAAVLGYDRVEPLATAKAQSLVLPSYDPKRRAAMVSWAGTF